MNELQDKVAIVTGASRGIGAATAQTLAAQGVSVVLAARSTDDIEAVAATISAAGGKASAVACDVSNQNDVKAVIEHCLTTYGRFDILVNNAAVIGPIDHIGAADPDAWSNAIDINVNGVFYGIRQVLPIMEQQGSGIIVNISSGAATSILEGWSAYCASKAAVLMLTRAVDKEYREKGVRCVGLSPGTVATNMQVLIKDSGVNPVSELEWSDHIPPEWAARAVAWLCTEDAREFDGGDVSLRQDDIRRRVGLI